MSDDKGFMCCNCGDHVGQMTAECRNCGVTLEAGHGPVTETEQRDIQIHHLKRCVGGGHDFKRVLLERIVALEAGEKPSWPKSYGTGAALWLKNMGEKKGTDLPAVTEPWSAYGKGGL